MNAKLMAKTLAAQAWPHGSLPIDPVRIASELGIDVIEADLPPNVSGALIKDVDSDPQIFLSARDSDNRKRFTCAHELGHYVYRTNSAEPSYQYVDFRDPRSASGTNSEEIFANQFAAELLMPEEEVRGCWAKKIPVFLMAKMFGVSDDAMNFRVRNLGLRLPQLDKMTG